MRTKCCSEAHSEHKIKKNPDLDYMGNLFEKKGELLLKDTNMRRYIRHKNIYVKRLR